MMGELAGSLRGRVPLNEAATSRPAPAGGVFEPPEGSKTPSDTFRQSTVRQVRRLSAVGTIQSCSGAYVCPTLLLQLHHADHSRRYDADAGERSDRMALALFRSGLGIPAHAEDQVGNRLAGALYPILHG